MRQRKSKTPLVLLGFALVALLLYAAWNLYGNELLRLQAERQINALIEGSVSIQSASLTTQGIEISGIQLFTPEKTLVASVDSIKAKGTLQVRDINIESIEVIGPHLHLQSNELGFNLARAVALRTQSTASLQAKPWSIRATAVSIKQLALDFENQSAPLTIENTSVNGTFSLRTSPFEIQGEAKAEGLFARPLKESFVVTASAFGSSSASISVLLKDTSLKGHFDIASKEVSVDELRLTPEVAQAFVPQWPLKVPLFLESTATTDHIVVSAKAADATLEGRGHLDLQSLSITDLQLSVLKANPKELFGVGQPIFVGGKMTGEVKNIRGQGSIESVLDVTIQATRTDTKDTLAKASARIRVKEQKGFIEFLKGQAPGATAEMSGTISSSALDLKATVNVSDSSKAQEVLTRLAGVELPAQGEGTIQAHITGSPRNMLVSTQTQLERFSFQNIQATGVSLQGQLPSANRPLDADAVLHARTLTIAGRTFSNVDVALRTETEKSKGAKSSSFSLKTHFESEGVPFDVAASGLLDADAKGAQVDSLSLLFPDKDGNKMQWKNNGSSHVAMKNSQLSVRTLVLENAEQEIQLDAFFKTPHIEAHLRTASLDIEKLPRFLLPHGLALAGIVSASVNIEGEQSNPHVGFDAVLSRGSVFKIDHIEIKSKGEFRNGTLDLQTETSSSLGAIDFTARFPLNLVAAAEDAPIVFNGTAHGFSIRALESSLGRPLFVEALVDATVHLSGTIGNPQGTALLTTPRIDYQMNERAKTWAFEQVTVKLETRADNTLSVAGSTSVLGSFTAFDINTPFTVYHLPTAADFVSLPLQGHATVAGISITKIKEQLDLALSQAQGALSLALNFDGSIQKPRGTVSIQGESLRYKGLAQTKATLSLHAADDATSLSAQVTMNEKEVVKIEAELMAQIEQLQTLKEIRNAKVRAKGVVTDLRLSDIFEATRFEGLFNSQVELTGALENPIMAAHASIESFSVNKLSLGHLTAGILTGSHTQNIAITLDEIKGTPSSRRLSVDGSLEWPLYFSNALGESSFSLFPKSQLDLAVESKALNLKFLSGIHPLIRNTGGQLNAKGNVRGTVEEPTFSGSAEVSKGVLALAGFGNYHDLSAKLDATSDFFELKNVHAVSGGGAVDFNLEGQRVRDAVWQLRGQASSEKFPIVFDDQLVATIGTRLKIAGVKEQNDINLTSVEIAEATIALPEVKRKDLQPLERPVDIVLLKASSVQNNQQQPQALRWHAQLDAARNIRVRSSDVNVELGLSEGFRFDYIAETQLHGQVDVLRGNASVIGREFEFLNESKSDKTTSSIRFDGPPAKPYVDVKVTYTTNRQPITTVNVALKGKFPDVKPVVSSQPSLNESQIYTLLATGRTELDLGAGASLTTESAASAVGQFVASQVRSKLIKEVPIDVFNFEALDNFKNFKIEVGKYLSDTVFVGITGQTAADQSKGENAWTARLEWQLSRSVTLEAWGGTAPAAGLDVVWSADY
jgi:translocation and assembly module TamB